MRSKVLRLFLYLAAVTWAAAIPGVFLRWDTATAAMEGFGAGPIAYDRMLDYWLRMASGAFGLIGCLYLLAAISPRKFRELIPWLAVLALAEGFVLIVHGIRLGLGPWPFYGDVAACLVSGLGILFCRARARVELYGEMVEQTRCSEPGDDAQVDNQGSVAPGH